MRRSNKLRSYHYFQDNHDYKEILYVFTSGDICHPWDPTRFRYIASDISLYFPMPYECTDGNYYGMSNVWEAREFLVNKRNAERSEELLRALLKHNRTTFNKIIPPTHRVNFAIALLYLSNIVPNPLYEQVLTKFYGGRRNATMLAVYSLVLRDLHSMLEEGGDFVKNPSPAHYDMKLNGGVINAKGVAVVLNSVPDQESFVRELYHLNKAVTRQFRKCADANYYGWEDSTNGDWVEFAKWLVEQIYNRVSRKKSIVDTLVPALADHIILSSHITDMNSCHYDSYGRWVSSVNFSEPIMSVFCTPWFRQTLRFYTFPWDSMDDNMTTRCRHRKMIDLISRKQQRDCTTIEQSAYLMESPQIQSLMEALDAEDDEE